VVSVDAQFVRARIDEVREAIGRMVDFHTSTMSARKVQCRIAGRVIIA